MISFLFFGDLITRSIMAAETQTAGSKSGTRSDLRGEDGNTPGAASSETVPVGQVKQ